MAESRVVLPGSVRSPLNEARVIGPAEPEERLTVTVVLKPKSEVPRHTGSFLTAEEFAERHGASPESIQAVREFAEAHGLTVVEESAGKRTVELSGTVTQMNAAFSVNLQRAELNGKVIRQRTGEILVPESLAKMTVAVLGLDNRPVARPRSSLFDAHANPHAGVVPLNPVQVAKLYGFPTGVDGTGQTIAVIELGGGFSATDLKTYFTSISVKVPTVTAVAVSAPNSPGTDPGSDLEVMLDIEVIGGVAPGAKQLVYFAKNTDADFLNAVLAAVHATPAPAAISISWGHPESTWTAQSRTAFTQAFTDAGALGIPCFVASGDAGSSDGTSALAVDFPASSPEACGCGGTSLIGSGSTITSEVVWNDDPTHSSGGGVSVLNAKPSYQSSANVPAPPSGTTGGRGVPDVSGHAAAWQMFVSGKPVALSGTSAVAPLWAGLSGLLAQKLNKKLGFLNTTLYASSAKSAFRDITKGTNDATGKLGKYSATTGWDACTGLGSPNGGGLVTVLGGGTPTPTPTHPTPTPTPTPTRPTPTPTPTHPTPTPTHPTPTPTPTHPTPTPTPTHPTPTPPTPTPTPTPPTPVTSGTSGHAQFSFPELPSYTPPPALPEPTVIPSPITSVIGGGNSVALVGVVGLAAVMGMVAATGLVAVVAINKDK